MALVPLQLMLNLVFPDGTHSLRRIQTLSLSTAFINYSWDWLGVVQHEEVMSILQNALFKSKLLKAIDSAMVVSEEVDFRVIHHSLIKNTNHAGRLHNEVGWNH